jgi:hypothetical protein
VGTELDAKVGRLLFEQIASYEELEALLLLHKDAACTWTVDEVAERLRIDAARAATALAALRAQRLLEQHSGPAVRYRYSTPDAGLADAVDRLARLYDEQRLEIIRQMSANAIERLRSSAARTFADAFLLRGGRHDR